MGRNVRVEISHMPKVLPATNDMERTYQQTYNVGSNPNVNQPPPQTNSYPQLNQVNPNTLPVNNNPGFQQTNILHLLLANPQLIQALSLLQTPQTQQIQPNQNIQQPITNNQINPSGQNTNPYPTRVTEPQRDRPPGCNTVFVGNLSYDIKDDTIRNIFKDVGEIKAIRWLNDKKSGKFKGCGFIEFHDPNATFRAAMKNGTMVMGRPMRVDFATERPEKDEI